MRSRSRPALTKPTAPKMSKADARYVPQATGSERCGLCDMFRMMDACTAVEGRISPRGWCRLYESALGESPFQASETNE